jgi:tRNA(Ile)-lysidine synthetase-like protein
MALVKYWISNEHLWFNASKNQDKYLGGLFLQGLMMIDRLTPEEKIICYDQFSRHFYRDEYANHITTYFSHKAMCILEIMGEDTIIDMPDNVWVWMMMPFRHVGNVVDIKNIIATCWIKLKYCTTEENRRILKRFIKASYNNLDYRVNLYKYNGFDFSHQNVKPTGRKYKHILEHAEFALPIIDSTKDPLYAECVSIFKGVNFKILLMLSGGVDSMVCLHMLLQIPNINIEVVHINYCNRCEDSDDEELFLREWCKYNSIDLTVKRFSEINRRLCMDNGFRTFYEQYTKEVKFKVLTDIEFDKMIVGHNKDDVLENILTNISRKQKYEELQGMTMESDMILRPLLNTSKEDIFKYAHKYKIPYFKNSTPEWSQRAKIRDIVVPAINRWNPGFTDALQNFAEYVKEIDVIKEECVHSILSNNYNSETDILETTRPYTIHIWKSIFNKLFLKGVISKQISQASLEHFMTKINGLRSVRVNLTKYDCVQINNIENKIIVSFKKTK